MDNSISLTGNPLILIADDEEANRMLFERMLRKSGVEVVTVADGKQAVDICLENPEIKLVLMDMKMPVMDGFEATNQIKVFKPNLPVIAITAFALNGDERKVFAAGCDDYLAKPLKKEDLVRVLTAFGVIVA